MPLRTARLVVVTLLGAAAAALVVELAGVRVVEPAWRERLVLVLTVAAGLGGGVVTLMARRWRSLAADSAVVAAGVLLAGASTAALHGTRWGWFGLYADSSFRTQMATRYAESIALVDYNYRGLPAYYPPALGWLEGRLAAVTDLSGWEAVKPVQLVVAALVPLAAYLLWRPVAGALPAAAVAGLVTVWTAHPQKPDEWLVLACLLPWWILTVRDLRAEGVQRWSAGRLGLVLGLMLLIHTYWFLPFGVATVIALGYDAARSRWAGGARLDRQRSRLPWRRALTIGAWGLVVSAVFWLPMLSARLRLPSDSLQMRYAYPYDNVPYLPLDATGVVGLVGLAWLGWTGWRWLRRRGSDEMAGALALALAGALATLGLGAVGEQLGIGLLAFKSNDVVRAVLLVCGVLGAADWLRRGLDRLMARSRDRGSGPSWVAGALPVVLVAAAAATAGHHLTAVWVTGPPALVAQTTRYPDGLAPTGSTGSEPYYATLFVDPADPSVDEVREAWRSLRPDVDLDGAVLVTSQVDLLATTPVYGFLDIKSIYSHPNGRFEDRVALLQQVASCPTSSCAADLLRHNDLDPVDGLVLRRSGDALVLPFVVDDFPNLTRRAQLTFPDRLLRGPNFTRRDLGPIVVVALRP